MCALSLNGLALHGAAALMHLRFVMWELDTSRAKSAASLIVTQLNGYREQAKEKQLVISGMPKTPGPDTDLVVLDLAFGMSAQLSDSKLPENASDAERFVKVLTDLVTVAGELKDKATGNEVVWQHSVTPLLQLAQRGLLEAYLFRVAATADQQGAKTWLDAHSDHSTRLGEALRELTPVDTGPRMHRFEREGRGVASEGDPAEAAWIVKLHFDYP